MDQGVISIFKCYYLINTFYKAITATDSDSSDGLRRSRLKTFWKGFTFLNAIKNIFDSWKGQYSNMNKSLREVSTLMDKSEESKTSVGEVTIDKEQNNYNC